MEKDNKMIDKRIETISDTAGYSDNDELKEECGVFGIYNNDDLDSGTEGRKAAE